MTQEYFTILTTSFGSKSIDKHTKDDIIEIVNSALTSVDKEPLSENTKIETALKYLNSSSRSFSIYKADSLNDVKVFVKKGGLEAREMFDEDHHFIFHRDQIEISGLIEVGQFDQVSKATDLSCTVSYANANFNLSSVINADENIVLVEDDEYSNLVALINTITDNDLADFNRVYGESCDLAFLREDIASFVRTLIAEGDLVIEIENINKSAALIQ